MSARAETIQARELDEARQAAAHAEQKAAIDIKRITALNGMAEEIGAWAERKGFREEWCTATAFDYWKPMLPFTVPDGYADTMMTAVIASKLALIDSESSEALEALRNVGASGVLAGQSNFVEELADIIIRTLELAELVQGDIGDALVQKLKVNEDRAHKHGKRI